MHLMLLAEAGVQTFMYGFLAGYCVCALIAWQDHRAQAARHAREIEQIAENPARKPATVHRPSASIHRRISPQ